MAVIQKRKNKKGTSYLATIRRKNYPTICKTFKNLEFAQKWAREIENSIDNGTYNKHTINDYNIKTVADLIMFFRDTEAQVRYSDADKYNFMYNWWILQIGYVELQELTTNHLASCKITLLSEKTKNGKIRQANTINKYLMCMSAVLTYAVKELQLIKVNPMSNVSIVTKPEGRKRFLSKKEMKIYFEKCKEHSLMLYVFALIGTTTGGRYSEVRTLKVENIDFNNNQLHYIDTKNKTSRSVYIEDRVLNILKIYLKENNIESGYIFINPKTGKLYYIRGMLQQVIENANLKDFHIHDERHTFASYMAMSGASLLEIADALGQKSLSVARRYSHLTKKHLNTQVGKAVLSMDIDIDIDT